MKRTLKNLGTCMLLAVIGVGCTTVGPPYEAPTAPMEQYWLDHEDPLLSVTSTVSAAWWKEAFNDPVLDQLVELALAENLSLQSAGLRVLQAQQQRAIAIGGLFPQQQQASGSASKQKASGTTFDNYALGFNVGWELDFWGRFRLQVESATAGLEASVASYDGALVSLVAQVAGTYIQIRTLQDRIVVARENIKLQEESLRITSAKSEAGEVSELDTDQAESLVNNTRATVVSLELSLQQAENSLAVLLGKPPHDISELLGADKGIPSVPSELALGMPQDLIRQRPDIRVAERQLAAQSAQIGYAITELYPHLSIGGSVGTTAEDSGDLFTSPSQTWSGLGSFQWNLFNYGRLKNNVRLQDAVFQQLLLDYRDTVLQAQADVENAIVAYLKSHEQLVLYQKAAEYSKRAVDISNAQYEDGLVGFNTVISTLSADAQQQDLLASIKGGIAGSLIQVYTALGGGWEIRENRDPVNMLPDGVKEEMRERTGIWKNILK